MVIGTTIGNRFVIEREIGSGGMGTVYRALDRDRGIPVAVKVLGTYKPDDIERFVRESKLLAELAHPGIVRHVAHGHVSGHQLYYVMEWARRSAIMSRTSASRSRTASP